MSCPVPASASTGLFSYEDAPECLVLSRESICPSRCPRPSLRLIAQHGLAGAARVLRALGRPRGVITPFESADYGISGVSVESSLLSSGLAGETPRKRDANIKSRILDSLNSFVLATSRRTYRQGRAFRVVSHLWAMATVRPLRFIGVLLVLYAMMGSNVFSPAEVPAEAVRVLLWLFFSGVVALIVDEVSERIRRESREARDSKAREREQKPK
jgi:hypothetical protein